MKLTILMLTLLLTLSYLFIPCVYSEDSQIYSNQYGTLEVYPMISYGLFNHLQYWNLTSNVTAKIDIAFAFDSPLLTGGLFVKNIYGNYTQLDVSHIVYNNRQYYIVNNINVVSGGFYSGKIEYEVNAGTSGKWDLYVKLSSDTWNNYRIHLDPWFNTSYTKRKDIWVDNTQVYYGVTDFPVLVRINADSDIYQYAQNDLDDLVFVNDANTSAFPYQIENYSINANNTVTANIWVKVSGLNAQSLNHFNMYFGNNAVSNQSNYVKVWDSNYLFVGHFNGSTTTQIFDSTQNKNHGTFIGGSVYPTTGRIGTGLLFDNTDDYISLPSGTFVITSGGVGTVECWFDEVNNNDGNQLCDVSELDGANSVFKIHPYSNTNDINFAWGKDLGSWTWDEVIDNSRVTVESFIACRVSSSTHSMWRNGGSVTNSDIVGTSGVTFTATQFYIGVNRLLSGEWFNGMIDEYRVSKISRNNSWLVTEYNNILNGTGFLWFGSLQTYTPPVSNTLPNATNFSYANFSILPININNLSCYVYDFNGDIVTYTIADNLGHTDTGTVYNNTIKLNYTSNLSFEIILILYVNISDAYGTHSYFMNYTTMDLITFLISTGDVRYIQQSGISLSPSMLLFVYLFALCYFIFSRETNDLFIGTKAHYIFILLTLSLLIGIQTGSFVYDFGFTVLERALLIPFTLVFIGLLFIAYKSKK